MLRRIAPAMKIFGICGYFLPWYCVCTNAKFILKGSYGYGEPKNAISLSVQKLHRPVWVNKLPRVLQRRTLQVIDSFKILGLPIAMVPCLHQCNVYIKRNLRVWRAQKFNFLVSAKTAPTSTGVAPYRPSNENFRNFGATFYHGTVFAPMQSS